MSHPAYAAHAFGDQSSRTRATSSAIPYAGAARLRHRVRLLGARPVRLRSFGIRLPHSSWADLSYGRRISRRSLRPGDLVFFYGAGHVGIYVGHGRFLDAPHSGARVRISTMGAYSGYYGARRFRAS